MALARTFATLLHAHAIGAGIMDHEADEGRWLMTLSFSLQSCVGCVPDIFFLCYFFELHECMLAYRRSSGRHSLVEVDNIVTRRDQHVKVFRRNMQHVPSLSESSTCHQASKVCSLSTTPFWFAMS